MLPHSISKTNVGLGRPSFMAAEYDENEINDYFDDNGVILEDEEEYDVLNDETFGEPLGDEPDDSEVRPAWEEYDSHNDETFGEEISFDWEAEHEKMVSDLEIKDESASKPSNNNEIANKKLHHPSNPEQVIRNGFRKIGPNKSYLEYNDLDGAPDNLTKDPTPSLRVPKADKFTDDAHSNSLRNMNGGNESPFGDSWDRWIKNDDWFKEDSSSSHSDSNVGRKSNAFAQDYSLFSGTNLLQNAGIHIPSVPKTTAMGMNFPEDIERKMDALAVEPQPSTSIPNVSDLETQWFNHIFNRSLQKDDIYRNFDSPSFASNSNSTPMNHAPSPNKLPTESPLFKQDKFGKVYPVYPNTTVPIPVPQAQAFPSSQPPTMMNGDCDPQLAYARMRVASRIHPPIDPKSYPAMVMCDNGLFRNAPNFRDMNAQTVGPFVNNQILNRPKTHPGIDPSVIVSAENAARHPDAPLMMDNSNLPRLGINVFQPPPGLTIDPMKLRHFQHAAALALQARPPQMTSSLALQPIQVLNGIAPDERRKQLSKFQKEERLSVVDEYAGMMTEREKYWLAGVQLLQINAMDPFVDDYYFTNYQARRRGNRGKSQTNNNKKWQNEHTKDYSPLQFENSLGKVQVGSVVAPRKVIDTDIFESSPKHKGKLNDSVSEDPMANTSHRKRRAIMLHIENLFGKIIALETLLVNAAKNKTDPATVKVESASILNALREEIINLKDDFKILMSIRKGKRVVLKLLMLCDNPEAVWFQIFEILEKIIRGDLEDCMLLSYLPYFRMWLTTISLATMNRLSKYLTRNLNFHLRDKFSVSVMANMIEQAEMLYYDSRPEDCIDWMGFITTLAENAHQPLEDVQKPVVSVKPQTLRSHLLKFEKLENGSVANLLRIFSNNMRRP